MPRVDAQPWFEAAVQLLDLRRQDRVLVLHAEPQQVRSLAACVGSRGEVTAVQPDRESAETIAAFELPQVEVMAHTTRGDESFGSFDALLAVPRADPGWAKGAYADLPHHNLRPGGRLVLDLPGPDMVPDLHAVGRELGWSSKRLSPLRGYSDDQLAEVLRNAGLRAVQTLLGSHLLHLDSPYDLVDAFADALAATETQRTDLGQALVRRFGTTGAVDALVHRTRLVARR
jgi:hypothetical protein